MKTRDVYVEYDLQKDKWIITPDHLPITEPCIIVFYRLPDDAPWTFKHINGVPATWQQHPVDKGAAYHVHDPHGDATHDYAYTVVVHDGENDKDHEFPHKRTRTDPPIIMNEP